MDKAILLPSAVLGGIIVVIYLINCVRKKTTPQLNNMIGLFLGGPGLVAGFVLIAGTFSPNFSKMVSELPLYIFIAGMALTYHTTKSLWDQFK